jgi:hypothetical protein
MLSISAATLSVKRILDEGKAVFPQAQNQYVHRDVDKRHHGL